MQLYKSLLLIAFTGFIGLAGLAQRRSLAWYGQAEAGTAGYRGSGARSTTYIFSPPPGGKSRFMNPYSSHGSLALRAGISSHLTGRRGWVLTGTLVYEQLRSHTNFERSLLSSSTAPVNGDGYFTTRYITLNTMAGRQLWKGRKQQVQLMAGLDHALLAGNREEGTASSDVMEQYVDGKRDDVPMYDLRLCGQLSYHQGRFMLLASYHHGLTNFKRPSHPSDRAYSQSWTAGFGYRIF